MKWSIPERIIAKGRKYLENDRVLSVTPDPAQQVWHAQVLGSELYQVDLDATAKEEDFCQCPYWEEHHYCKHTVAVELYLRQEGKTRQLPKEATPVTFSTSDMFTNGLSRLHIEAEKNHPKLSIEVIIEGLETNPYHSELDVLGVSLKVGLVGERQYVVKNVFKFLQVYMEEKSYVANKKHTFTLTHDVFDEETRRVLSYFNDITQTQQLLGQMGIQVKGKLDKKYFLLPVEQLHTLLETCRNVDCVFQTKEQVLFHPQLVEGVRPLHFSVVKDQDQFVLHLDEKFDQLFQHYNLAMMGQTWYVLTPRQVTVYLAMDQLRKRLDEPKVRYTKENLSEMFRQIVPLLEEIAEVTIAPEVHEVVAEFPLRITYLLKKRKQLIDAKIHFAYEDTLFSTDEQENQVTDSHQEVLRDLKREQQARERMHKLGFVATETGYEKPIPQKEALFRFFTMEIPYLREMGDVRMGKKLRELYLDARFVTPEISVDEESSWLAVKFDVSGIGEHEVDAVLRSLLQQDQFYTLENGQIVSFETEAFEETAQVLQQLRQGFELEDGVVKVPKNQGLLLEDTLGKNVQYGSSFKQMTQDLLHPEKFDVTLPKGLNATLRDYQVTGFRWLKMLSHYQFGGILADEMGLGKTLQTICYLLSEKQEQGQVRTLIVAPASLTYNWSQEIKQFAPELSIMVVSGTKEEREHQLAQPVDIYITSYASMRSDIDHYQVAQLDYLILDEAQMVKNSGTKTAQALRSLQVAHRFALSGTPIENNLDELWSLFQMIMPGFFPNRGTYRQLATSEIAQMIQPFILRRDKATVLKDLPEKIETNYYSGLTNEQKTIYLAYLRQMQDEINQMDSATFKKNRISILAGLTRLRQICCDPRLFIDDYEGGSGKLDQVKDLLLAAKENNRRVLLFSQFTSMLTIIEQALDEIGLSHFYLRGSTPPKDRIEMVDAFNEGDRDVFLISLKAGGTGLNLTGADTVILYDLWWNPAVEEQAAGRAHRMGQEKVVEVWRMIAEGTIEERMNTLQNEKRELFQKVIQGNETQLQQMTEEDIRLILSIGEE